MGVGGGVYLMLTSVKVELLPCVWVWAGVWVGRVYGCVGGCLPDVDLDEGGCGQVGCVGVGGRLPDFDFSEGGVAAQCVGVWVWVGWGVYLISTSMTMELLPCV